MKMFAALSILAFSLSSLATIYPLAPGQSMFLGDGSQVICQGGFNPPPPPPPVSSAPACSVKFNPSGNPCGQYVVYDSTGTAASQCLGTLDQLAQSLHDLREVGTCGGASTTTCSVKFNPSGNPCGQYVIFDGNGLAISACLADMDSAVEPALRQLKQLGVCAY